MMTSTRLTNIEKEELFDAPAIFYKILQKKVVKSQHAMFSRRKGEAEDDSDDDINIVNEF